MYIVPITATISAVSTEMMPYSSGIVPAGVIVELIAPFIGWLLCAGAVYAFSIVFGGVGSFKRVLEFTGYGFVPQILSMIFSAVLLYIFLSTHTPPPQFMVYVIAITGLLLLFWSVAIWVFAVQARTQYIDAGGAFHGGQWRIYRVVAGVGHNRRHSRHNKLIEAIVAHRIYDSVAGF